MSEVLWDAYDKLNDMGEEESSAYWSVIQRANLKDTIGRGQPSKFEDKYCAMIIHHMSEGFSYETFASRVGVSRKTIYNWEDQFGNWKAAKKVAFDCRKMKWEGIIANAATGKSKGNAAAIIFALKNYYPEDYKDKREIEHNVAGQILVDTGVPDAISLEDKSGDIIEDAEYHTILPESKRDLL